jgi:hypothetical protein
MKIARDALFTLETITIAVLNFDQNISICGEGLRAL